MKNARDYADEMEDIISRISGKALKIWYPGSNLSLALLCIAEIFVEQDDKMERLAMEIVRLKNEKD